VPSMTEPSLGEVWDVNFDPQVGREQGGVRPALVISNDEFNRVANGLYFVVPITGTDRNIPLHIRLQPPEGGLTKPSVALCDQARAQSEQRFLRRRGEVSPEIVTLVQAMVGVCIDR
jgi:mRNA interferase MazF